MKTIRLKVKDFVVKQIICEMMNIFAASEKLPSKFI